MKKATLLLTLLPLAAPAVAGQAVVTVTGTVTNDVYTFGPYASAQVGDTVVATFVVTFPGTPSGAGLDHDVAIDSLAVDINGPIPSHFSAAPVLHIENDTPNDLIEISSALTNGDFFGCDLEALASVFGSDDIGALIGSYDLTVGLVSSNFRFSGAGGFLGITPESLEVSLPVPLRVTITGEVLSNSYSSGPFGGATSGDTAILSFDASGSGTEVTPGQVFNYEIDPSTFDIDINGSTGAQLGGSADLQIRDNNPVSDGLGVLTGPLATGQMFSCSWGAVGSFFDSTQLVDLVGSYDVAANLTNFGYTIAGAGGFMEIFPETLTIGVSTLGTSYCVSSGNSTGQASTISALGSTSLSLGVLTLQASNVPTQPGLFYFGPDQILAPFGNGFRCVGGTVTRMPILTSSGGVFTYDVDFATYGGAIGMLGTANFQCWYRDPAGGGMFFNLSDALEIVFTP